MATIGAYEAKTHLPELLKRVESGEHITIARHGTPVAVLVPSATTLGGILPRRAALRSSRRRAAAATSTSARRSRKAAAVTRSSSTARSPWRGSFREELTPFAERF